MKTLVIVLTVSKVPASKLMVEACDERGDSAGG